MTDQERAIIEAAFEVYLMDRARHYGPAEKQYRKAIGDLCGAVAELAAENDGKLRISE